MLAKLSRKDANHAGPRARAAPTDLEVKRVRNTLVACALAATLLCAPPLHVSARHAPTPETARQLPQPQPTAQPTPTPTPSQQQDQRPARRADETQPPLLPPAPPPPAAAATPEQRPAGVDEDDVLNVDTSLVNVVFNATDADRRFVTTLKREDVRVFEDGVPQEVTVFQRETELPLSIAILVDVSVSQKNTLPIEKDAARAFINQILRPGKDTAAVISFTGSATLEQDMTQDRASLYFAIDSLRVIRPPGEEDEDEDTLALPGAGGTNAGGTNAGGVPAAGGVAVDQAPVVVVAPPAASAPPPAISDEDADIGHTSIWDAVWAASNEVLAQTPPHTRRAVILLSDGDDTKSRVNREAAAEAAVKSNTIVYSIGIEPVGYKLDKKALRKISEATGGRAFFPEDEIQLNAAFHQIQQELRTQYSAAYTPTNKARDGSFRRLRIEFTTPDLKKQKLKLAYREGYFALTPTTAAAARRERAPQDRLARPPRRHRK